jgi:hypothetical protein
MGKCPVEPADFDNCLSCYAYKVAQDRESASRQSTSDRAVAGGGRSAETGSTDAREPRTATGRRFLDNEGDGVFDIGSYSDGWYDLDKLREVILAIEDEASNMEGGS